MRLNALLRLWLLRRGRCVALDVARGLHYLHHKRIVHLDLKRCAGWGRPLPATPQLHLHALHCSGAAPLCLLCC